MLSTKKSSQRFSLLLLDEGEYYFEDFSAFYYPPGLSDDEQAFKRRIKGRLKLCSASLMFDPEDIKLPILKIPFKYCEFVDRLVSLFSKLSSKADIFLLHSNMVVEMKENNQNFPYIFKQEKMIHRFSLNYVPLTTFLPQLTQLITISKMPVEIMEAEVRTLIEDRENSITFNTSALEDINEKIGVETRGLRITPLVSDPGRILITNTIIYFQPFNNITANPVDKFRLDAIVRMQKRRYILRNVGIEIFMENGESVFFAFKNPGLRDSIYETLIKQPAVLKSLAMDDQANMTLKWQNRLISNYDYLMYVNNMAGRTFNDLTQYPVFPWVIGDYTSKTLDLKSSKTFRDFSKPIGALNPERLKVFKERMEQMPDDSPKFLYGTHYSTPGYVLFYLVREAPEFMLRLQNGKFDAPSRMFHSIAETWAGVLNNPADVKEVIPEFYKDKSFLINSEHLNLGVKPETGVRLDDVVLPPWATDAEDFIQKCALALESDYVSDNLHHWIDLIFGYKQQGEQAILADNIFYPLTYEGAVDIDSIQDPLEKQAIIAQIKEFGQTPKQVFSLPHPQRLPKGSTVELPSSTIPSSAEPLDLSTLLPVVQFTWKDMENFILDFSFKLHKDIISNFSMSADGNTLYSVSHDSSLKIYELKEKKQLRGANLGELALSSCQLTGDEKHVIAGSWDNNIYVYSIESGRLVQSIPAHDDAVSCLCLRNDVLLSGSWDGTVKYWEFSSNGLSKLPVADFSEYETEVRCLDITKQGNVAVSGQADGSIAFLDLRDKNTVKSMQIHDDCINCVQFTPDGSRVVTCSDDQNLKILEIGGSEIFSINLGTSLKCLQNNGEYVLVGGEDGTLFIYDLRSGVELRKIKGNEPINCLLCSDDGETLVVGGNGNIRVFIKNKSKEVEEH